MRDSLHDVRSAIEQLALLGREGLEKACELPHPAVAAELEHTTTLLTRLYDDGATVRRVRSPHDETVGLEASHEPAHRRRGDLLGVRQLADRPWPAEDENREGREAGRREPALVIDSADAAEQVDRGRVEPRRDLGGIGGS